MHIRVRLSFRPPSFSVFWLMPSVFTMNHDCSIAFNDDIVALCVTLQNNIKLKGRDDFESFAMFDGLGAMTEEELEPSKTKSVVR